MSPSNAHGTYGVQDTLGSTGTLKRQGRPEALSDCKTTQRTCWFLEGWREPPRALTRLQLSRRSRDDDEEGPRHEGYEQRPSLVNDVNGPRRHGLRATAESCGRQGRTAPRVDYKALRMTRMDRAV